MDDFSSQHNKKFMSTNFNGVTEGNNPGPGGPGDKKWRNYKLLVDPILKKGQQKLYRYDGVAPGPSGADFSVTIVRDPRSRLSRFWKGREKYDLPVPKFKYDKHYVGELPPKQVTFTNLNDNIRDAFLRNMCEKYGTIEEINICFHPKTRKHLGLASVTFSTTRAARQAVMELNRTSVMGKIIIVQIDAGGTECERIFDCLVTTSTPSSSSSTPRDPRHSITTPDTPTPRSGTAADPRRSSLESKTPSVQEGNPLSVPDHPFIFPEPHGFPMGSEQGFPGQSGPATPGLSGNFGGMNMHEYGGAPSGPQGSYPRDFNRGGMEQYPPHSGNFMPPEHHAMYQQQPQEQQQQQGLPPGFPDPNGTMPFPQQMPHNKFPMPIPPGFHGHQNANFNMYQDSQAWDHQNYGQPGARENFGYSNQPRDAQLGYGNHGHHQQGQWDRQYGGHSKHGDYQGHHQPDSDALHSHGKFSERNSDSSNREAREDSSDSRSKKTSKDQQRDAVPISADDESHTSETELATEREAATPVQDEENKPPGTDDDDNAAESNEFNMSLDSRIEALLKRQSGLAFGFDLDSSANSGQGDSTSNDPATEFSPCRSPLDGDSPLLDEPHENRTSALHESGSEHSRTQSPVPHGRYDIFSHEKQDTAKHKSRTDKSHLERKLGHASFKRLQHYGEGSTEPEHRTSAKAERYATTVFTDDSCSRDSFTSYKSTPEIGDPDKASNVPSGASTPTVSEHTSQLDISAMISRGLSNLRNIGEQVPAPVVGGSPFVEHQGSVDESLGSTPVESEPQTSKLLAQVGDSQSIRQVQLEIAEALASREDTNGSPSDMDMDDDRMSMSSLSSGEDTKLEVNVPVPQRNERSYVTPPVSMLRGPPEMPQAPAAYGQWPGMSLPGYSGPFSSVLMTSRPSSFNPGVNFGVQSQYPGANPYAIPQSVSMPGFPGTSIASGSLPNQFTNQWAGMTAAQFGQMASPQHTQMQMMARMGPFQAAQPFNLNQPGFPVNQTAFQDQAQMPGLGQGGQVPIWQGNMPPPPHFQQFLQQFPQQFQMPPTPDSQSEQSWYSPPKPDPKEELVGELLKTTFNELKKIMKKDIGRKMVESSAFKSLEAWWDDCELKFKEPLRVTTDAEKPSPKIQPLMSLSFHTGPWAMAASQGKNVGLASIGLGLGVRAAMPRMPSFKVKRKVPEEDEDEEKKHRAETPQFIDEDMSDNERDKDASKTSDKAAIRRPRKSVVSDEDEDEERGSKEIDVEDEDDEEDEDEDEEEDDEEDDDEDESASDFEDEMGSVKSESESSDEEEEDEVTDMSDSDESSSGSEMSSSEESDSEDEAKEGSRKDSKAIPDIKRDEKLAKITEEKEEAVEAKVKTDKEKEASEKKTTPTNKKAVNGDVTQKEAAKDKIDEKKSKAKLAKESLEKTRKDTKETRDEDKPSQQDVEVTTEVQPDDTMNSFDLLVELATKARTELLDEKPGEIAETVSKAKEIKGVALTARKDETMGRVSAGDAEARLPEAESIEEEVVMESVEDMELEMDAKKRQKAALPKETADDQQQPLPFLDHSYCQRPPPSTFKEPPKKEDKPVMFEQPSIRLVKLALPDKEVITIKEAEDNEIIDVVTEPEEPPPPPKKQKSSKRKHQKEELSHEEEVAVPEPSKPQFMPRNYYEEWTLLYQFLAAGVDQEDAFYLRKSYESMLQEGKIPWLSYTHWVSHSLSAIPDPPKKKRKMDDVRLHATGTARTEGFYKITSQEKKKYLRRLQTLPQDKSEIDQDSNVTVIAGSGKHNELSREARSDQRRAMATLSRQDGAVSDLLKFNQLKFRKKELKFLKSGIHGWGLYAMQPISADEMVIEYVGESIRQSLADKRETSYEKLGIGSSYLFRIDADSIIDATKTGNLARFINHSCTPNCYAKIISMESQKKIVIYSKQNISTGEEITYDYKFPIEDEKIPCLCGTSQCRGTLN